MSDSEKLDAILADTAYLVRFVQGLGMGGPRTFPPVEPPSTPPVTPPTPPVTPRPTPAADTVYLGDMTSGSPLENEIHNMNGGTTYAKHIVGVSGWEEFRCGPLANYNLANFSHWLSAQPGGPAIQVRGCGPEDLNGNNVGSLSVNIETIHQAGVGDIFYNVRADGPTGRYMQRNP